MLVYSVLGESVSYPIAVNVGNSDPFAGPEARRYGADSLELPAVFGALIFTHIQVGLEHTGFVVQVQVVVESIPCTV